MAQIKALDQKGIYFLISKEGLVLKPYLDSVGIATIGIGATYYPQDGKKVTMKDKPITKEQAIAMFKALLVSYETAVWSTIKSDINQNQFNALVSFCYNVGRGAFKSSTVAKRVNGDPNDPNIADAFLMWNKPKEIIGRRKSEVALYFS